MVLNLVVKRSLGSGLPPELELCHIPTVGAGQVTELLCAHQQESQRMEKAQEGCVFWNKAFGIR